RPRRSLQFSRSAAEKRGKGGRVSLEQHVGAVGAVRTEIGLGVRRDRAPAQRSDAGALPADARQEELDAAREGPRPVAAHRVDGGALDQRPAREHRVGGATARGLQACAALAELLGEIARPLAPGLRRERAAMPVEALDLLREAIPELRAAREVHRVASTEERRGSTSGTAAAAGGSWRASSNAVVPPAQNPATMHGPCSPAARIWLAK